MQITLGRSVYAHVSVCVILKYLLFLLGLLFCHLHLSHILTANKDSIHCHYLLKDHLLPGDQTTLTSHTVMLESAEPVTILLSLQLPWRPHTLS